MKPTILWLFMFASILTLATPNTLAAGSGCNLDGCGNPDYGYIGCDVVPNFGDCCASGDSDCKPGYIYYYAGYNKDSYCNQNGDGAPNQCNTYAQWDGLCMPDTCPSPGPGPSRPACDDGTCEPTEQCGQTDYCPTDCTPCPGCGNSNCESNEECEQTDYCEQDCGTCVNCGTGFYWDGNQCVQDSCGASSTTTNCILLNGIDPGYYCSDGINTDDGNPNTGTCCPTNTVWDGIACTTTQGCDVVACPAASPISPPVPPNAYYSTVACVSTTAHAGNPGACCNVGTKYGVPNYYDYSNSTGGSNNNFQIY